MQDYHINVFYSEQDQAYVADIPDLEVCSGTGETPQRALAAVLAAKDAWVASALSSGRPLPRPHYAPARYAGKHCHCWSE